MPKHSPHVKVEPAQGVAVATTNLHLRPALPANCCQSSGGGILRTLGPVVQVLASDLGLYGDGGLCIATSAKGPGSRYHILYRPGKTTNVVWHVGDLSKRELDRAFFGPDSPARAKHRLLPGLSTHLMTECDLLFGECMFTAADLLCRRFRWAELRPEQQAAAAAAAAAALAKWWSG